MRFWWVNQNQTFRHEVRGGYLWSPKRKTNGAINPFYESMREVAPGDLVFSFADRRIAAIGIAESYAYEASDECVVAVLQEAARPHPSETAYVFTNTEARPMHTPSFTKNHWRRVLDELRIRPRKFYATRPTFISISLSNGINAKFIAEYCGTSLAMIEKHYGRYIRSDAREQLALNRRRAQRIPHSEAQSPGSGRVRLDTSRERDETDCQ